MEPVYTEELGGKTITIFQDSDVAESPRDWDNLGTMVCEHPHYNLGDCDCKKWHAEHSGELPNREREEIGDYKELFLAFLAHENVFALPLYLLDHSGLWMRTSRFAEDPGGWDTSHIGYIYIAKAKFRKEFGKWNKRKARELLEQEVTTYSDYLIGNVWGYRVVDSSGESVDSCSGFIGDYDEKGGCLDQARGVCK